MAGSLKMVGEGKWQPEDSAARSKPAPARCRPVAPACGLFFMKVDYGESA